MSDYVYFMRAAIPNSPIKIGHSWMPEKRLMELTLWSPYPLEIILTIPGDAALERNIHSCFADCHSHSEWFKPSPRLTVAIRAMQRGIPVHEAIDLTDIRGNVLGLTQAATRKRNGTKLGRKAVVQ